MIHKFSGNQIETIVFDLGGVLIDWNPTYVYNTIFKTDESIDYFLRNICTHEWNEQQDGGRPIKDATELLVTKFPHYTGEITAFYGRWEEMLGGQIDASVAVLKELIDQKKYKIVALTNWSSETFPIALERYEFLSWFDDILVSGKEHLKKPDPAIYNLMLNRFGLDTHNTLFIDDNVRNIKSAELLGIHGVVFENGHKLRNDLQALLK